MIRSFARRMWSNYVLTNDWAEVQAQCHPVGLTALFVAIATVQVVLCVHVAKYEFHVGLCATACAVVAVLCDVAAWIAQRRGSLRYAPPLILIDSLGYSSCVAITALHAPCPYAYLFWAVYFAVLLYWGYFSEFSALNTIAVSAGPVALIIITGDEPMILAVVHFALVTHVFAALVTTKRRRRTREQERVTREAYVMNEMMIQYRWSLARSKITAKLDALCGVLKAYIANSSRERKIDQAATSVVLLGSTKTNEEAQMDSKIPKKLIEWLELLYSNGAIIVAPDGKSAECNPVVREHISAMHATLAAGKDNDQYRKLEATLDEAFKEANTLAADAISSGGAPGVYWP